MFGTTSASENFAAGVKGEATADDGKTFGVTGDTGSSGIGAAGVEGSAYSGSGQVYGVRGSARSEDRGPHHPLSIASSARWR